MHFSHRPSPLPGPHVRTGWYAHRPQYRCRYLYRTWSYLQCDEVLTKAMEARLFSDQMP